MTRSVVTNLPTGRFTANPTVRPEPIGAASSTSLPMHSKCAAASPARNPTGRLNKTSNPRPNSSAPWKRSGVSFSTRSTTKGARGSRCWSSGGTAATLLLPCRISTAIEVPFNNVDGITTCCPGASWKEYLNLWHASGDAGRMISNSTAPPPVRVTESPSRGIRQRNSGPLMKRTALPHSDSGKSAVRRSAKSPLYPAWSASAAAMLAVWPAGSRIAASAAFSSAPRGLDSKV